MMGSLDVKIKEWLAEYKALSEAELHTYASTIRANQDLIDALYDLLNREHRQEDDDDSVELHQHRSILDPVCHQLFEFYRSSQVELQLFTLEFVPVLMATYLFAVSKNHKKNCSGIEACLLGIYNLELVNPDGSPKIKSCTIPLLSKPSVYHEPYSSAPLSLTESALSRHDQSEIQIITHGPFTHIERMKASNRLTVLTYVLNCYNASIAKLSTNSHQTMCSVITSIVKSGFDGLGIPSNDVPGSRRSWSSKRGVSFAVEPRVMVNRHLMLEMASSIYYIMYNTHPGMGTLALEAIHKRASYELLSDVLLVTNAIRNSMHYSPGGEPSDGPMGISIAISPSATTSSFTKAAITNASFRAKKLPDDIPVVSDEGEESYTNCVAPSVIMSEDVFETTMPGERGGQKVEVTERPKSTSGAKISIKSVLKKTDKAKRRDSDVKPHVTLNMSLNGDSEPEKKKMSVSIIQGQVKTHIDNVELKSYSKTNDVGWARSDSDSDANEDQANRSMSSSSSGHFRGQRQNNLPLNTEV
ncbi:hyccin-like isoform X2 [Lineus longissimus]|uniref:hyccin-like isoform X2 n=1 Tax=Lineus longissimus TaxID=88925 RepID=UPI002B4F03F2